MKKVFIFSVFFSLCVSSLSADALKNSLTNMLNTKESTPSMVDLSSINMNGKSKSVKKLRKKRSGRSVVAIVNGHKILKKEADAHLKKRTRGKISDFDLLPKKQRFMLIREMALPILALESAKKEISPEEKEVLYSRTWMQKEALKIKITDEQAQKVYDQIKQRSQEKNTTANFPEFEKIKNRIKSQMLEKQIISKLMKDVKIKVEEINQ
ncbi:MAG: hypothetical protein P794_05125 [Epsilonproteobacteria bacterium (ex Lamellibrachia satsuma)]|nr:MAG: hypothetical protein P794_05125 [Epsilonproteobacteria bacterium (ex Lamellibrachia satsuma)]